MNDTDLAELEEKLTLLLSDCPSGAFVWVNVGPQLPSANWLSGPFAVLSLCFSFKPKSTEWKLFQDTVEITQSVSDSIFLNILVAGKKQIQRDTKTELTNSQIRLFIHSLITLIHFRITGRLETSPAATGQECP